MLILLACSSGDVPTRPAPVAEGPEQVGGDTAPPPPGPPWDHLPVLLINAGTAIGDGVKTDATLAVIVEHDGTLGDLDAAPRAFAGPIGIEIHGSSSSGYPKLGYRFECRDTDGEDANCALAGLPEGSDWVLNAPYSDKTYMRNALAYALGREVAARRGEWEPRTQFVEIYLDDRYQGIYVLTERVSREPERLAIPRTTRPDGIVAGGFIVKVDQHRSAGFDTARATPIDWADPHAGEVTADEAAYLASWFDRLEAALAGDAAAWPAWIDVDGWIDHWLLNELAHNIDAFRLSAYLWTDGPPGVARMHAGPLWDFDRAFGDVNYCEAWTTDGWIYDSLDRCGYAYQFPFWWERLRSDPAWLALERARWQELRAGPLADDAIAARIAAMRAETAEAEGRDHALWGNIGVWTDPNWYVGESWDAEIAWLQQWTVERMAWMDQHVGEP